MKMPTPQEIEKAKAVLKASGIIDAFWCVDDIIGRAEEREIKITRKQADEIADFISRKHDASVGINWEVIDCYIDMYFNP